MVFLAQPLPIPEGDNNSPQSVGHAATTITHHAVCLICQSVLLARSQRGTHCTPMSSSETQLLSQFFFRIILLHRDILPRAQSFAVLLVKIPKICVGTIPKLIKACLN